MVQSAAQGGDYAGFLPPFDKLFRLFKVQHHSGKGLVEIVCIHFPGALGRIVDIIDPFAVTFQDHEMIEIPKKYRWQGYFVQLVDFLAVSLGPESVAARSLQYVTGLASVPGYPAFGAQLLQRYPFAVIGQNGAKSGGTAFYCLHLKNCRCLDPFPVCSFF